MYFTTLVIVHLLAAAFWVGGLFYATFVLIREIRNSSDPQEHRPLLKRSVRRFRQFSLLAAMVLLITGLMLLPQRTFREPIRFAALSTMIVGWALMSALVFGTMPEQAFSGRPDDVEEKEREQWNPDRLFRIHAVITLVGTIALASGAVLAYHA